MLLVLYDRESVMGSARLSIASLEIVNKSDVG